MPSVTIPKSFFVKERRMYSQWQFAFWREFFQNSIDAGATRIDVQTVDLGDNRIQVIFTDNGSGMSRDTLENVYFRLGATTKENQDMVGGFGRARILTCFSMADYKIHTRDNLVIGDGGDYQITEAEYFPGCEVTVTIEEESYSTLMLHLDNYLRFSNMSCDVFLNDVRYINWLKVNKCIRHLEVNDNPFASVYLDKESGIRYRMTIRVRGVLMYTQYVSTDSHVVVEIDPDKSRTVLTANRDSMQADYSRVLNEFSQELASETKTALMPKFKKKNMSIRGRGLFYSCGQQEKIKSVPLSTSERIDATVRVQEIIGGTKNFEPKLSQNLEASVGRTLMENLTSDLPDIFIVDDTTNEKIRKVIDNYVPVNWVTLERNGKMVNKGSVIYKLLMFWKIACEHAVDSLLRAYPQMSGISWGIGWVFSDSTDAICHQIDNGHALLLNPVDAEGNLKFFISSMESQKKLMAYAKHEVAHICMMYHNEEYALTLTHIDVHFDERIVYRRMREFTV